MSVSTTPGADDFLRWELAIARRDAAAAPEGLASLIDPEFFEFGSSGRVWPYVDAVASLSHSNPDAITIDGLVVHPLAQGVALVTYRMTEVPPQGETRHRRRSSIWMRRDGRWVMRFHQGTSTSPM